MPEPLDAFSVKDMLLSVLTKLDRMDIKLDTKADETALVAVAGRVQSIERVAQAAEMRASIVIPQITKMQDEVEHLKELAISLRSVDAYRRWLFGTAVVGVAGLVLTILQATGTI